jgi:hypothetical protein
MKKAGIYNKRIDKTTITTLPVSYYRLFDTIFSRKTKPSRVVLTIPGSDVLFFLSFLQDPVGLRLISLLGKKETLFIYQVNSTLLRNQVSYVCERYYIRTRRKIKHTDRNPSAKDTTYARDER